MIMTKVNIEGLSYEQLTNVLTQLKDYRELKTKLWKRGRDLFQRKKDKKNMFLVEYYPGVWESSALDMALRVYDTEFRVQPHRDDIILLPKEDIGWGIKVYKDDMMLDMSFAKIKKSFVL